MRNFWGISRTGLTAILLHPLRSVVTIAALIVILVPYTVGQGISQGLLRLAEDSIRFSADLSVTGSRFGRNVPIAMATISEIEKVEGVTTVIPRIVGHTTLGKERESVVLVGLPVEHLPSETTCVEGRLYTTDTLHEIVVGTELAKRLRLTVGTLIPPFYRNDRGEHLAKVVGVFKSNNPMWQARLVFTSLESAATIFDQEGFATELLVECRSGYEEQVRRSIMQIKSDALELAEQRLQVTTRRELRSILPGGVIRHEGLFNLHFVLAFVIGILVILVTSGFGISERRQEIGILKATGWQTDEILLRSLVESLLLSLCGFCISLLAAFVWLYCLNGYWISGVYLTGVDASPTFQIPFRLMPVPALLCFLMSFVLVLSGTLYSTWRAAIVPPSDAMRWS